MRQLTSFFQHYVLSLFNRHTVIDAVLLFIGAPVILVIAPGVLIMLSDVYIVPEGWHRFFVNTTTLSYIPYAGWASIRFVSLMDGWKRDGQWPYRNVYQ